MSKKAVVIAIVLLAIIVAILLILPAPKAKMERVEQEFCQDMSLGDARAIAERSDCVDEGSLEETYFCNDVTGTWWIDLDINREGCNPACVIHVETGQAEINWRCTGLLT